MAPIPIGDSCPTGGVVIGGVCYPDPSALCGLNTVYDTTTHKCKGVGGGSANCSTTCDASTSTTICATGTVRRYVDNTSIDAAVAPRVRVRIYDPNDFTPTQMDPGPIAITTVDDTGCFVAKGVRRTGLGLLALTIDDNDTDATDDFARAGVLVPIPPNDNLTGVEIGYIETTTIQNWDTQIGPITGNCGDTLALCGAWIAHYRDHSGDNVGNATPTRPSDDPTSDTIFCFRGDRMHLNAADTTDDATGTCLLSPDNEENHSGRCAGGADSCTCGGSACNPQWLQVLGGSLPRSFLEQDFQAL